MSAVKYDIEKFLTDLKTFLQENYPTYLSNVKSEKGDSLPLPAPLNEAYFIQTWNDEAVNHDPCIVIQAEEIRPIGGGGPTIAEQVIIYIQLMIADNNDRDMYKRLFRYLRAMREMFVQKYDKVGQQSKIYIESLPPSPLQVWGQTVHYVTGVKIEANFA